jgi:hypothetical protein
VVDYTVTADGASIHHTAAAATSPQGRGERLVSYWQPLSVTIQMIEWRRSKSQKSDFPIVLRFCIWFKRKTCKSIFIRGYDAVVGDKSKELYSQINTVSRCCIEIDLLPGVCDSVTFAIYPSPISSVCTCHATNLSAFSPPSTPLPPSRQLTSTSRMHASRMMIAV